MTNELNTASQVSHPNICKLYDIFFANIESGVSFITMELRIVHRDLKPANVLLGADVEITGTDPSTPPS